MEPRSRSFLYAPLYPAVLSGRKTMESGFDCGFAHSQMNDNLRDHDPYSFPRAFEETASDHAALSVFRARICIRAT